jgi:hypothetical protein
MSEDEVREAGGSRRHTTHDEAFKKLLQTFFREFIELFFPELDRELDYSHTRFLMQELLVDIVGQESRANRSLTRTPSFTSGCLFTLAGCSSVTARNIS